MVAFIRGWIINIVTLSMFITLVEIVVPEGKMRKFVNLVSGVIFMIAMISPFAGLASGKVAMPELKLSSETAVFKDEVLKSTQNLKRSQENEIVKLYKQNIISKIKEMVDMPNAEVNVEIDERYGTDKFGRILFVYICSDEKKSTGNDIKTKVSNKIISGIASTFGLNEENIKVSTKEER